MSFRRTFFVSSVAVCLAVAVAMAAQPNRSNSSGNSYHLFTKTLDVDNNGVVVVPSRFKWSVETTVAGVDADGNAIPNSRLMLRLYDPDRNFTAVTAYMDLPTAARLHHELGKLIVKKLENPDFQHRPRLYDGRFVPTGELKGVDENGVAIIELRHPSGRTEILRGPTAASNNVK